MIEGVSSIAAANLTRTEAAGSSRQAGGAADMGVGFGDVLRDQMAATANAVRGAEAVSTAAINGEADVRAVTDAVMEAERKMQAAVGIRDKIVTAYLDMTRMQI